MPEVEDEDDDEDSEDALSEFDFLGSGENGEGAGDARRAGDGNELGNGGAGSRCKPVSPSASEVFSGNSARLSEFSSDCTGVPRYPLKFHSGTSCG